VLLEVAALMKFNASPTATKISQMPEFHYCLSIMPKRHGQLKEYSIGPSKVSTANCAQLNKGKTPAIPRDGQNGPTFAHAILTTQELLARLPGATPA
jgi:hypothetical protein